MAGELTSISLAMGMGVVDGNAQPVLGNLSVAPSSATVGTTYTGTVSGKTAGSTLTLSGAGSAGLSVSGSSITGTPTASGAVNVIETLAGATGSPKTNASVISVASSAVSPDPIVIPASVGNFWSLIRSSGYNGPAIRVQRQDGTEQDFSFDANQILDGDAVLAFVGSGPSNNGYVTKVYDHKGAADQVQVTQSLMPYIVKAGVLVKSAAGVPMMQGALEGRYLAAPGSFTVRQGQDYSMFCVAENDNDQITPVNNAFTPLIGISTAAGSTSQRSHLLFGARSAATGRNVVVELATVTAGTQEIAGPAGVLVAKQTTSILTANCQTAALTGGPGAGSTLYFNRGPAATVENASHSPSAFTTATDIRLFALGGSTWGTNSANGASGKIAVAAVGAAMTNTERNSLEAQIYDKLSVINAVSLAASLPKLGATGEAWNFAAFASDRVSGVNAKTGLNYTTAANGATVALGTSPNGIAGLKETGKSNFKNDYEADNTFGNDKTTWTMFAVITGVDIVGANNFADLLGMSTGTLGQTGGRGLSALLSKDHSPFCAYTLDATSLGASPSSDYTNMMTGQNDPNTGAPAYLAFSPFWGGGMLTVNVGAHDNNSDHPNFYTKKKMVGNKENTDGQTFNVANGITYVILAKHRPHPNYNLAEPFNSANNVLWRNKADVEVKMAVIGGLDGFKKIPGSYTDMRGRSSTAIANPAAKFRHYGGEGIAVFDGFMHSAGFFAKYTTDAEDQALFYKLNNPANVADLAT